MSFDVGIFRIPPLEQFPQKRVFFSSCTDGVKWSCQCVGSLKGVSQFGVWRVPSLPGFSSGYSAHLRSAVRRLLPPARERTSDFLPGEMAAFRCPNRNELLGKNLSEVTLRGKHSTDATSEKYLYRQVLPPSPSAARMFVSSGHPETAGL